MCVCVYMQDVRRCIPGGREASLEKDSSRGLGGHGGRAPRGEHSVGCFKTKKRSVGSVGHIDGLGSLRVACSHHAYTPYSSTK